MADLIERKGTLAKLIALRKDNAECSCENDIMRGKDIAYENVMDIIARMPAVNRWISVEDSLPEQEEEVWCCCYGSDILMPDYEHGETVAECIVRTQKEIVTVQLGFVGSDGWYTIDGYPMIIAPTYWMPLNKPEPPEKESEA